MSFAHHVTIEARCTKRWRGANFDAATAEGNVGAAVAATLGMSVRTSAHLEAFLRKAFVRAYGAGLAPNPNQEFDISEGEAFAFHIGLREAVDEATLARIETAAREAVATSRHFVLV